MRQYRTVVLTIDQHRQIGRSLLDLRRRLGAITGNTLSGRVPAPVLDAALKVDRHLATLCIRLADTLGGSGVGVYTLDAPVIAPTARPTTRCMSFEEHRTVGAELYQLRNQIQTLSITIANHHPKASRIGRAAHRPERAFDTLRCKLDDLLCQQHREQFDTHIYYPGTSAVPSANNTIAIGGGQ